MATVRALKPCYVGHLREVGEVFDYFGPAASYLALVSGEFNVPAPKKKAAPVHSVEQDVASVTAERDSALAEVEMLKARVAELEVQVEALEGAAAQPVVASESVVEPPPLADADDATRSAIEGRLRPFSDEHVHAEPAPKAGRTPEEEAERAALFATFKDLGVKVFAGSTTEKLRTKLAEIEAATAPK